MFSPKFKQMNTLLEVAKAINAPHDEDLTAPTVEMLGYYTTNNYDFMERDLRIIHSFIARGLPLQPSQVGRYRIIEVDVGGDTTCPPHLIEDRVSSLFPVGANLEAIQLWYRDFQVIHPFADGNGRVGGIVFGAAVYNLTEQWWGPCQ